jgi:diguanylate cyclase (GGDEF)-like protein
VQIISEDFTKELLNIVEKLKVIEKMYQATRLVDPATKRIKELRENFLCEIESECYKVWTQGRVCQNCISMRAYQDNDTFVKMEHTKNKIYLITSVPVVVQHKRFVLEMMKDITSSMVIDCGSGEKFIEVQHLIDNINKAAIEDSLTKVYNRRFINERMPAQIIKSKLNNESLSIIFIDIDHFKLLNDTYGHCAGDYVLKGFADELMESIRKGKDWVARYGGEEFLICLPYADLSGAQEIAERIRKNIQNKVFNYQEKQIKITASFGVCSVEELEDFALDALLEKADRKLYQAKSLGRNRVVT